MIPVWLIITIVMVLVLIIILRATYQSYVLTSIKDNAFSFILILIFIFLIISLTKIHSTHDIDFTSSDGLKQLAKIYYLWIGNIFSNLMKVTGYAVSQDWTSAGNSTR